MPVALRDPMQRLFSTFPNGWPGSGLLLLRLACCTSMLIFATDHSWAEGWEPLSWGRLFSCVTAALILAGLWTPLAASWQAVFQGVLAFEGQMLASEHLVFAVTGLSLVMLGPGAWSIDARLYGRKRIDLRRP